MTNLVFTTLAHNKFYVSVMKLFLFVFFLSVTIVGCKKCYFCEEKISGVKEDFCEGSEGYESLKGGKTPTNWKAKTGISYSCGKK